MFFHIFGKTFSKARRQYNSYVKEGVELGYRPELAGGGLIRSLGGWEAVKKMRKDGYGRVISGYWGIMGLYVTC